MILEGKKALITGASGGIGAAIATTLHASGVRVALSGTNEERLKKLAHVLPGAEILVCHLREKEEAERLVESAETVLGGPLDILVNNAGVTKDNLLMRMSNEEWDEVIAVNLTACFLLSRSAIKSMIKNRFGRIIHVGSVVGATGNPGQVNYCASKAGLVGFSKALALEVASRGITVNTIAPGFIDTNMTHKLTETARARIVEQIPLRRIGVPADIAECVLYLAKASYVTGQTIHINGGLAMV
jgi:3-oxoacyl-[acyl-carrier protein] reductase